MSDPDPLDAPAPAEAHRARGIGRRLLPAAAVLAAAIVGGFIGRNLAPLPAQRSSAPARPIVQIVRQQPGLPSLADTIDRLCPSFASIAPADAADRPPPPARAGKAGKAVPQVVAAPAFAVSADGWLLTSGPLPEGAALQAVFGDGRRAPIVETRTDPVSGLAIVRADTTGLAPLAFDDHVFARVGDFGFAIRAPGGTGCSAATAMIGSDFLVDGAAQGIFLHLQDSIGGLAPGSAWLASDGNVLAVASPAADNALIPAPLVALIVDELIRNSPSPIAGFGFRAVDFTPDLAARIGNSRQRGVGIALVQPGSTADKAGLKAGDAVLAVADAPVASASELSRALDAVTGPATLTIVRGAQQLTVTIKRPKAAASG